MPDYSNISDGINDGTIVKAPSNGYVYVSNSLKRFKLYNKKKAGCNNSTSYPTYTNGSGLNEIDMAIIHESREVGGNTYNFATTLPLLVPISKGSCYWCENYNVFGAGLGFNPTNNIDNKCYFIPLKKAKTTIISE